MTRNILDYASKKYIYCMRGIYMYYKCETQNIESNNFSDTLVFNDLKCGFLAPLFNFLDGVVVNVLASYFWGRRFEPHLNQFFY